MVTIGATDPANDSREGSSSAGVDERNPRLQRFESAEPADRPQYRRRFSDMAKVARTNMSSLANVEENAPVDRPRRSLDGTDQQRAELPIDHGALPDVVLEAMRVRGQLARTNSTAETAADSKGKRYNEMMERFQVRRVSRSPSMSAGGTGAGVPNASTARDAAERQSSMNSIHEPLAAQASTSPHIPPLPSLAGRFDRAYTDTRGMSEADATQMTPRGSMDSMFATRSSRSSRLSIFWRIRAWKRRLMRDFQYVKQNIGHPISPSSLVSRVRLALMMLVFTVHVVVFPLETAFLPEKDGFKDVVGSIEVGIEIVLIIDFLLMFNTSYYNKRNVLVQSRKAIAKHYLRSWFLLDLASSVPVDLIIMATDPHSLETRWIHFVYDVAIRSQRIVHIMRVARYMWTLLLDSPERSMFEWMLYSRYSHLFRIAWIILFIILIAHYLACGWKLLALGTAQGAEHAVSGLRSPLEEYVANFYDVLQLLQGQGVPTTSVGQNIYATAAILMGSVALAIIFGHVAILVSNFNANSTNYQRKMESVFAIMSKLQLPAPLRERIHQYYEHLWREYESLDGEIVSFSKGLSHTLELEVVLFKYMDLIMHVPFWSSASPDFQKQLMLHLSVRVYLPDDFIIRRGEVGDEFFMINRGICELALGPDSFECTIAPLADEEEESFSEEETGAENGALKTARFEAVTSRYAQPEEAPVNFRRGRRGSRANMYKPGGSGARVATEVSSKYIQKLRRGQSFGELALFMNYERTANVRALTYVEMCVLQRRDFQKILVKHPADRKHVLTSMLTKTMENNEATKVWCPLKAMVHSVFSDGDPQKAENVSAMHAALLISSAVNLPLDDESIKFGISERLRDQLVDLRDKQRQGSASTRSTVSTTPVRRMSASQDAGETQAPTNTLDVYRLTEHVQQLEHVQTTMAMTLMDLSREVHTLRTTNERLYQLVGSYEARLVELLEKPQESSGGLRSKRHHQPRETDTGNGAASKKPTPTSLVVIKLRQGRAPFHRQRSASMSSLNTSRGDVTSRQPPGTSVGKEPQEPTQPESPPISIVNRRASFAASRSHTATNLHDSTDAKLKPRPHHLGPIEGVARSAFNSVKSLLAAEPDAQKTTSPTKYADQLFDSKTAPAKK